MLIDNKNTFDMLMKMENKGFAKHLKKIFKKKFKMPKIKSDYSDGNVIHFIIYYLYFVFLSST
jgi:hypothetical protein